MEMWTRYTEGCIPVEQDILALRADLKKSKWGEIPLDSRSHFGSMRLGRYCILYFWHLKRHQSKSRSEIYEEGCNHRTRIIIGEVGRQLGAPLKWVTKKPSIHRSDVSGGKELGAEFLGGAKVKIGVWYFRCRYGYSRLGYEDGDASRVADGACGLI